MGLTDTDSSDAPGQSRASRRSVGLPAGRPVREVLVQLGLDLDAELLDRALTHRSYAYENGGLPTNERLEFLGDSVLGAGGHRARSSLTYPDLSRGPAGQAARRGGQLPRPGRRRPRGSSLGELRPARSRRGDHRRPRQVLDPRRHHRGGHRCGLPRARHRGRPRLRAPAVRPADGRRRRARAPAWTGRPACRRSPSLRGLGVPSLRGHRVRSRPRQDVRGDGRASAARRYGPGAGRNKKEAEQKAAGASRFAASDRRRLALPAVRPRRRRRSADPGPTRPPSPCPSCPRSRSSAAVWPPARRRSHASPRVEVLHPRPVRRHLAGPDDFAARLAGRTLRRACAGAGKYLWLPLDDGDALLAHLGMSGQFRFAADRRRRRAEHLRVRFDFADARPRAAVRRPAHVRRAVAVRPAAPTLPAGDRPHRPGPARPRVRPRRRRAPAAAPSGTGIKRALLDQTAGRRASATSTPTRRCGAPGCTTRGATETLTRRPPVRDVLTAAREVMAAALARAAAPPSTPCTSTSTARAATSTARWRPTARRASPARAAAPRSGGSPS